MDDLSSKINSILSDPQALSQIKELGEMLGVNNTSGNIHNIGQNSQSTDNLLSNISGIGSNDTLSLVTKFAPLLSNISKEDDTSRLLSALRPFLSDERRKKLDEAGRIIKMMRLLPMIKDVGILDSLF